MPILTVFAGPNGSGKSSVTPLFDLAGRGNLLDPDAIAKRIGPESPRDAAVAAGREVLSRVNGYIEGGEDFAIETTLSGGWTTSAIQAAQARGFFVRLIFVCVDDPEINVHRVRERVARGGHDIPEPDIRRRYARSLINAKKIIGTVNQAIVFNNSSARPIIKLIIESGKVVMKAPDLPEWAHALT